MRQFITFRHLEWFVLIVTSIIIGSIIHSKVNASEYGLHQMCKEDVQCYTWVRSQAQYKNDRHQECQLGNCKQIIRSCARFIRDNKVVEPISYRKAAEYICKHEGFEPKAYKDPGGVGYVIGCGSNARGRKHILYRDAISIVEQEVERLAPLVFEAYGDVSASQFDGIVSILYNTPHQQAIVKNKQLVLNVKSGNRDATRAYFERDIVSIEKYVGYSLNGLRKRRDDEVLKIFN